MKEHKNKPKPQTNKNQENQSESTCSMSESARTVHVEENQRRNLQKTTHSLHCALLGAEE